MDPETQKPVVWEPEAPAAPEPAPTIPTGTAPAPTTQDQTAPFAATAATPGQAPEPAAATEPAAPATPEPAAWAPAPAAAPAPTSSGTPRRASLATVAAVAITAAVIGVGGTVAALTASGALDSTSDAAIAEAPAQPAGLVTPGAGGSGSAQQSPTAAFNGVNDAVVNAASRVSPAVVTIISSTAVGTTGSGQLQDPFGSGQDPFGLDPFGQGDGQGQQNGNGQENGQGQQDPFGQGDGQGNSQDGTDRGQSIYGLPADQAPVGVGSGFVFDANGWILTNNHVVDGATNLTVQLADGRSFPAKVYGSDTLTDLAIVKIDATGLPAATLGDSSTLRVGQLAIAVGDPLGEYPGTVTTGVVSGLGRSISDATTNLDNLIQTDAAINPGNSGGPLVDETGAVIGIDTAIAGSSEGIGFAIPVNLAKPLMQQALAGQQLSRPWLGVRYQPLDAGVATRNGLSVTAGAWITSGGSGSAVESGSPADAAGLKEGDIITAVNGTKIDTNHPLIELIASHAPGDTITLTVRRANADAEIQVTLATRTFNTNG
jgi:S1-C subfamily serine protease